MFDLIQPFQVKVHTAFQMGSTNSYITKYIYIYIHIFQRLLHVTSFCFLYSSKVSQVWPGGGGSLSTLQDWFHPSSPFPGPFNFFVFHSMWNYDEVQKVIPSSAPVITILRDPVDTFESGHSYFNQAPKVQYVIYIHIYVHNIFTLDTYMLLHLIYCNYYRILTYL